MEPVRSCGKCQEPGRHWYCRGGCAANRIPRRAVERDLRADLESELAKKISGRSSLPTDSQARKDVPLARGLLDYFPAALAEVARLSKAGNDKHNPGEDIHWARGKSTDHADCILRHLVDRGVVDEEDGFSHTVKVAWRALALLQEELESRGAPKARGAR